MTEPQTHDDILQTTLARERPRLLAFCASKTGNPAIAEDLVQETLLEAWRHYKALREPEHITQWLMGIARNVCLRWARAYATNQQRFILPEHITTTIETSTDYEGIETWLADEADFIADLERKELADLLGRALTMLPPDVRHLLIAHYIEERPLAQMSEQLGLRTSAVAMRLQRGRLAMRRVLAAEFSEEVTSYDVALATHQPWEETRLWCMACGQRRWQGQYDVVKGELRLRCPDCSDGPNDTLIHTNSLAILGGVKGYQRAYARLLAWVEQVYRSALQTHTIACVRCGRTTPLVVVSPAAVIPTALYSVLGEQALGFYHSCPACDREKWSFESLAIYLLAQPEGRRFQQTHPRFRALPVYSVESDGRAALVSSFESTSDHERLVVVSAAETLETLRINQERGV